MKKFTIYLFILLTLPFGLNAQNKNVQELIREGVVLHDSAQYTAAIEKFQQALKINPQSTYATYEIALSYLKLKDYNNASKFSTQIINSNDKSLAVGAYAIKSEALAEMGRITDAIILLEQALRKYPGNDLINFNLALNYYKKGDIDNTLDHIRDVINQNKTNASAFLLYAHALSDKGLWVQSILSYQMFLLLEPDSQRSKKAFDDMLALMRIDTQSKQRSGTATQQAATTKVPPPQQTVENGVDRALVYRSMMAVTESLKRENDDVAVFESFMHVNKVIIGVLETENTSDKTGLFWSFYVPFFASIAKSEYYESYCRYISAAYIPESLEWWNNNQHEAGRFISWFENGDGDN